jgi:large subunit ribosomal protein L22
MTATAKAKYVRVSPQKARLVVDLIRGLPVGEALVRLGVTNKGIAPAVAKVLNSAVANARDRGDVDVDDLKVSAAWVDEGPRLKRLRPATMGRAFRYFHRMSHIIVSVSDGNDAVDTQETGETEE